MRKENNLTIKQLADKVGVNKSAVSFWESGTNEPKASYIIKLAEVFNVSTDYILGLETDYGVKTFNNLAGAQDKLHQELLTMFDTLTLEEKYRILGILQGIKA
ncbi:MAG: helix-turn-helix transcriptional regulator [Bacillota bacterium]